LVENASFLKMALQIVTQKKKAAIRVLQTQKTCSGTTK